MASKRRYLIALKWSFRQVWLSVQIGVNVSQFQTLSSFCSQRKCLLSGQEFTKYADQLDSSETA